jgi:hypothetical protein
LQRPKPAEGGRSGRLLHPHCRPCVAIRTGGGAPAEGAVRLLLRTRQALQNGHAGQVVADGRADRGLAPGLPSCAAACGICGGGDGAADLAGRRSKAAGVWRRCLNRVCFAYTAGGGKGTRGSRGCPPWRARRLAKGRAGVGSKGGVQQWKWGQRRRRWGGGHWGCRGVLGTVDGRRDGRDAVLAADAWRAGWLCVCGAGGVAREGLGWWRWQRPQPHGSGRAWDPACMRVGIDRVPVPRTGERRRRSKQTSGRERCPQHTFPPIKHLSAPPTGPSAKGCTRIFWAAPRWVSSSAATAAAAAAGVPSCAKQQPGATHVLHTTVPPKRCRRSRTSCSLAGGAVCIRARAAQAHKVSAQARAQERKGARSDPACVGRGQPACNPAAVPGITRLKYIWFLHTPGGRAGKPPWCESRLPPFPPCPAGHPAPPAHPHDHYSAGIICCHAPWGLGPSHVARIGAVRPTQHSDTTERLLRAHLSVSTQQLLRRNTRIPLNRWTAGLTGAWCWIRNLRSACASVHARTKRDETEAIVFA